MTQAVKLDQLSTQPKRKAPAKRAPRETAGKFSKMSPWGREFLRRLDKLHKAMDAEGFKFNHT